MDISDFQNWHLEKQTWAKVIRVGRGEKPKTRGIAHYAQQHRRRWVEFHSPDDINPGDIVAFNYIYNTDGKSATDTNLPDDYLVIPAGQIFAKKTEDGFCGLGAHTVLRMHLDEHDAAGARFDRDNTSIWNTGTVVGGPADSCHVATYPCMAIPLQYAHRGFKEADGLWVIETKYIFGYGR